jgi:putative transposase
VEREKAHYPVRMLCRVLGVSPSGYYAWRTRGPSSRAQADERVAAQVAAIHRASRGTYGAPRIHAELAAIGIACGRKRVARLMRRASLVGCHRRRLFQTTRRDPAAEPAPDLVGRAFAAAEPDRLWVADLTYVPTGEGVLYLAVVLDAFSRRVVGWSMAAHMRAELAVAALRMALGRRQPPAGLIHHSDHGSQYTSLLFGEHCRVAGIRRSMGSVGDCFDNALAESFFAYIEGFYNRRRRHSALGYLAPDAYERRYTQQQQAVA